MVAAPHARCVSRHVSEWHFGPLLGLEHRQETLQVSELAVVPVFLLDEEFVVFDVERDLHGAVDVEALVDAVERHLSSESVVQAGQLLVDLVVRLGYVRVFGCPLSYQTLTLTSPQSSVRRQCGVLEQPLALATMVHHTHAAPHPTGSPHTGHLLLLLGGLTVPGLADVRGWGAATHAVGRVGDDLHVVLRRLHVALDLRIRLLQLLGLALLLRQRSLELHLPLVGLQLGLLHLRYLALQVSAIVLLLLQHALQPPDLVLHLLHRTQTLVILKTTALHTHTSISTNTHRRRRARLHTNLHSCSCCSGPNTRTYRAALLALPRHTASSRRHKPLTQCSTCTMASARRTTRHHRRCAPLGRPLALPSALHSRQTQRSRVGCWWPVRGGCHPCHGHVGRRVGAADGCVDRIRGAGAVPSHLSGVGRDGHAHGHAERGRDAGRSVGVGTVGLGAGGHRGAEKGWKRGGMRSVRGDGGRLLLRLLLLGAGDSS
mmetsp:Transcript_42812/g.106959  ORF Transcript_42812/g.106959 Transcript_42812/m.106959 type:complete len:488 (+) Transcript_42812:1773-3236(+)